MSGGRDVEGGGDSFESGLDGLDKVSSPDKGIEDNTCIEQNVDNFFGEINNIGEINKDSEFNTSTEHVDYSEENNIDEFIDGDIDEISNIENDRSDEISRFDDIDSNIENFVDGNDKYNDNMEFNIGFEDTLQSDLDNFIDGNDVECLEVGDNNCDMPHEQGDTQEIVDKFIDGDIDDINPIDKDLSENDESIYDNIEGFIDGDIENPEGEENKEIEGQGLEEGSYVEVDNDVGSAEVDDIDESDIDKDSEIKVDNDVDSAEVDEIDESDIGEDSEIEVDNDVDSAEVDDIDESDIDEDSEIEVDNDVDSAEVDEIDESDIDEDSEIEVDNDVDSAEVDEIDESDIDEDSEIEVDSNVDSTEVDEIDESDIDEDSEIEVDNNVDSTEVDEIDESDIDEDSEIEVDNNVDSTEVDEIDESDIDEDSEIEVDNDVDSAEVDEIDESDIDEDSEIEVDNNVDSAEAKDKYQLESEYNKSLQDMTKYMSEHNYGKEDYAEYSKDPEWQDLNEKMQDAKNAVEGADTENNIREIDIKYENTNSEYIEDNNKYFGKVEIDENLNKIFIKGSNYAEFKEAYNLGGGYEYRPYEKNKEENINADKIEGITVEKSDIDNPDIFWSQHEKNGTLESFKDIVRNIPDVVDQIGKGRTINELLQDEKLSSCTRIYFLDKVKVVKNGDFYEFDGDGRHRVLAAREAGYDIPVEIIGEKIKVGSKNFGKENNSYYEDKKSDNNLVNEEKKDSFEEQEKKEIAYNDSDISKSAEENYSFVDSVEDIDIMTSNKKSHNKEKVYNDDNGSVYRVNDNLLPNNEYEVRGYRYKTDDFGRIIEAGGKLRLKDGSGRKNIVDTMDVIGKGDQKEGDQRGHIIGDRFDASNGLENMIPQDAKINMGDYKKLENELARCIMDKKDVYVHIDIVYPERNGVKEGYRRPEALVVTYNIDGKENVRIFPNMKK